MSDMKTSARPATGNALPKALGIALLVSLCLNFLAIGVFITMFWQRAPLRAPTGQRPDRIEQAGRMGGPEQMGPRSGYGPMGRGYGRMHHDGAQGHDGLGLGRGVLNPHMLMQFAPDKADAIRQTMQSRREGMHALKQKAIAARAAASDVLTDKTYSPEKFDAALKDVQAADHALEAYVLETVKACVAQLSPEERQKIMDMRAPGPQER